MLSSGDKDRQLLQQIQDSQRSITQIDVGVKSDIQELQVISGCSDDEEIRQLIRNIKSRQEKQQSHIDDLKALSRKVRGANERRELESQIAKHVQEGAHNNQLLRQATAQAMSTHGWLETEKRANLFHTNEDSEERQAHRRRAKGAAMGQDTANANNKLSELVALMNEQVSVSGSTLDKLVSSSELIGDTEHEFHNMSSTIQVSNKLLSKYNRRELTDKILFALSVCFFFGTVLYIIRKRMFPSGFGLF